MVAAPKAVTERNAFSRTSKICTPLTAGIFPEYIDINTIVPDIIEAGRSIVMAQMTRARSIILWTLQILIAALFLMAGGSILAGVPPVVEQFSKFEKFHIGVWFRYLAGVLEIAGAIGLLVPGYAFYGASILATVMLGAILSHLLVIGGSPAPAILMMLITGIIAYLRKPSKT